MADRVPPHSDDAEKSVLGAAMQSAKALNDVVEILSKEDFYRNYNGEIFEVLRELETEGAHADILTVTEALKKKNLLSMVGDAAYIGGLSGAAPSPAGAAQYARIVKEKAVLRRLIETAQVIESEGYDDNETAETVLERAEDSIFQISQGTQKQDYSPISAVIEENLKRMEEHHASGKDLLGLATGYKDLDKKSSGLQKQDLIILAARPSMGKTALALNIALNAAKTGARILVFSLEMGKLPLGQRLLSILSNVDLAKIRDGTVLNSTADTKKLREAVDELSDMNIVIDDSSGISVGEMKSKCKRLAVSEGSVDLVIVDYLQLMEMAGTRPENRTLEIAAISRALKQMAKEIDCPVMVLSQLSRDSEKRAGRPVLSDLRDSGAIEQDGDLIMFIHNKSAKEVKAEEMDPDVDFIYNPDTMRQILILKHRNGETGDVTLSWIGKYTKFGSTDYGHSPGGASNYGGGDNEDEGEEDYAPPF
jgi:replicative DNA helicase